MWRSLRRSVKLLSKDWRMCHQKNRNLTSSDHISVHPQVQEAVRAGQPVVAFESTIVTHGMPYPENLKTAQALEAIATEEGVLPATVGVLRGKLCVGLTSTQLEELAKSDDVIKIPKRELVWAMSQHLSGGTTVSATMFAAHRARIPVFVTGGIGGVHRGGETSFDVSSDLTELSRTPVCVVSAGVKSILDIPKTLEFMETEGVTVATYGPSKEFPAFYSPRSGVEASINVEDPASAARLIDLSLSMEMGSGVLIAVPIPEEFAKDGELIERAITQSVIEAEEAGIRGKEVTPFILKRVNELTEGKALEANIALIKNNTVVGCAIAKELAALQNRGKKDRNDSRETLPTRSHSSSSANIDPPKRTFSTFCRRSKLLQSKETALPTSCDNKRYFHCSHGNLQRSPPVVIGASIVDLIATLKSPDIMYGGPTNNGSLQLGFGGVARNLADCMSRLGEKPFFISALGNDIHARSFLYQCKHMNLDGIVQLDGSTATYSVVVDSKGDVLLGIGDLDINDELTIEHIMQFEDRIKQAPLVVVDGNPTAEVIHHVCMFCSENHIPVWFEPTCLKKATKPFESDAWRTLSYASPNLNELRAMYAALEGEETVNFDRELSLTDKLRECVQLGKRLVQDIYCLVITLDQDGTLIMRQGEPEDPFIIGRRSAMHTVLSCDISAVHYPPLIDGDREDIISVSGGGDCLAAAMITGILRGLSPDTCIRMGLHAATLSLLSHQSVPDFIRPENVSEEHISKWSAMEPSQIL